jgi:predicted DNA-binding transcriptional regulator YafY
MRRRMKIHYYSRQQDEVSQRDVSPQRLIYYRDNWYLDSWCHWRKALRSFSVDAIKQVEILSETAKDIDEQYLNQELASGYGIFSGADTRQAVLRFSPEIARWVSRELWHSQQESDYDESGFYILQIPYSQDTELIMDILKHGAEVEVLAPPELRRKVIERIKAMQALY